MPTTPIDYTINLLALGMVVIALAISASATIAQMIRLYRVQAWVLAAIVILAPWQGIPANLLLALVPIFLAQTVRPLLGRASLGSPAPLPEGEVSRAPSLRRDLVAFWSSLRGSDRRAEPIWLQHGKSRLGPVVSTSLDLTLIVAAFVLAYLLAGPEARQVDPVSLAVALALLLQGLFTMTNKRDIIAQIIGLLVAEHGLFLAAVKIRTATSSTAHDFVISLFFYLIITLTILVWVLPGLHAASGSIEVDAQRRLEG